jgi:hypothetical protein
MTEANHTAFYVSGDPKGTVSVMMWPRGHSGMNVTISLDPRAALRLAQNLRDAVEKLPRVAEASDLGIAA